MLLATAASAALAFAPFRPDGAIRSVSAQPPFHGTDTRAHRGIRFNYARHGRAWILSEWPRNGGSLRAFPAMAAAQDGCTDVHTVGDVTVPRGLVWSTPHGMVYSLLPDGRADARTIVAEWRRLVRRGACR